MTHIQVPLADLQIGDHIAHVVKIKKINLQGKGKKPWLGITISDKSGEVFAKKWGSSEEEFKRYQGISVALVQGTVEKYNDDKSVVLTSLAQIADDFSETEILDLLGDPSNPGPSDGSNASASSEHTEAASGSWQLKTKAEVNFEQLLKTQKPLKDCGENETLNHLFKVCNLTSGITAAKGAKGGIPFIEFTLGDALSQPLKGRLWRAPETALEALKTAKIVYVQGKIESYNGTLQIKYDNDQIVVVSDVTEADINALVLSSPYPIKTLANGIWEIVQSFQDPMLKKLCESLLKDPKNKNFRFVPAGLSYHHSWRSGLIEHTYRLLLLLDDFVKQYNATPLRGNRVILNRDTILTIGLYHDFFKHVEYTVECGYAPEGNLLKHLSRGVLDIGARTSQIDNFPELYETVIAHGVGAHHGKKEWDTIDTPACPEAHIVHWFDNLCSKLDPTITELNLLKPGAKFSTNRLKPLGSIPYIGGCKLGEVVPFTPVSLKDNYSLQDLHQCVDSMLGNIKNQSVRALCLRATTSGLPAWQSWPNYNHGLIEYTCRTMLFIGNFVNSYNQKGWPGNNVYLDSDFLVAGAFLQCYFKFKKGNPMLEDIGSCLLAIGKAAAQIPNFPDEIRDLMAQIVASQVEGAPELPICPESITNHYFLHLLHGLDTMNLTLSSVDSAPDGQSKEEQPMFGKKITLGTCTLEE